MVILGLQRAEDVAMLRAHVHFATLDHTRTRSRPSIYRLGQDVFVYVAQCVGIAMHTMLCVDCDGIDLFVW